jgi:8-oxo-dGTP diphosphatase
MIVKAGLLLFRRNNNVTQLLFAQPHGKPFYVLPGGKQEPGETIEQALLRELDEELQTGAENIAKIGTTEGHTPDGTPLQMHLYSAELIGAPTPHAEIATIVWFSREQVLAQHDKMTPMTLDHIVPFLDEKNLW